MPAATAEDNKDSALKAVEALHTVLETSRAHLSSDITAHAQLPQSGTPLLSSPEELKTADIIDEVVKLLKLISKEVTALSLALAPPKVAFPAVKAQCEKLADLVGKLVYATNLLHDPAALVAYHVHVQPLTASPPSSDLSCSLLSRAWRSASASVIETLVDLAKHAQKLRSAAGILVADKAAHRVTLSLTGIVWQSIENAIKNGPHTEFDAFSQFWIASLSIIDDALSEVKELVDSGPVQHAGGSHNEATGGDDFDDFDDFAEPEMSEHEHEVASSVHHIMKLVRALLKRIPIILQDRLSVSPIHTAGLLARILSMQETFTATHDDLASALHPPQVIHDVIQHLKDYIKAVTSISAFMSHTASATHIPQVGELNAAVEACRLADDKSSKDQGGVDATVNKQDRWLVSFDEQIKLASSRTFSVCATEPGR